MTTKGVPTLEVAWSLHIATWKQSRHWSKREWSKLYQRGLFERFSSTRSRKKACTTCTGDPSSEPKSIELGLLHTVLYCFKSFADPAWSSRLFWFSKCFHVAPVSHMQWQISRGDHRRPFRKTVLHPQFPNTGYSTWQTCTVHQPSPAWSQFFTSYVILCVR